MVAWTAGDGSVNAAAYAAAASGGRTS